MAERNERLASEAKPEDHKDLKDEQKPCVMYSCPLLDWLSHDGEDNQSSIDQKLSSVFLILKILLVRMDAHALGLVGNCT